MPETVLVTELEFDKAEAIFAAAEDFAVRRAAPEEPALAAEVRSSGARAVIVGVERYAGALYEALSETSGQAGAILARFGVGHDGVDKQQCAERGLVVTNTPGALDASVAEHAIWLMGACARHVAGMHETFRDGAFAPRSGEELGGKTLAVMGLGPIGQRVARIASHGLSMRVLGVDILGRDGLAERMGQPFEKLSEQMGLADFTEDADAVLGEADVVSLHLPAVEATRHFIDADRLERFRQGALLVNTARGSLVDESALYDALASSRLGGAGLDVFAREPYEPSEPTKDLRTLENVVLTPHVGSNTRQSNARMAELCLRNLRAFFAGRPEELSRVTG